MAEPLFNFFLAGIICYVVITGLKIIFLFLLALYYKENLRDYLHLHPSFIILEMVLSGLLFSALGFIAEFITSSNQIIQHILCILLIALIPSYHFLVSPIQYLFGKSNPTLIDDRFRQVKEKYGYRIKMIRKNVINAYATGILPFTKTVLIGEPLMKK